MIPTTLTSISCRNMFVEKYRWAVDEMRVKYNKLHIRGWTLATGGAKDGSKVLVNGEEFDDGDMWLPSPDLAALYPGLSLIETARFHLIKKGISRLWRDNFLRVDYYRPGDSFNDMNNSAWYYSNPEFEEPLPDGMNVARVIGVPSLNSYCVGGATTACRFSDYLLRTFDKPLEAFGKILDFGCGASRISRYVSPTCGALLYGADIDEVNLLWSKTNISRYYAVDEVPLVPPTKYASETFDLVWAVSVFTHLLRDVELKWLEELRRIVKPGAILLVSIRGAAQLFQECRDEGLMSRIEQEGCLVEGINDDIYKIMDGKRYYVTTYHSSKYISETWGRFFEIVDIVPCLAAPQDVVVMRRK